MKSSFWSYNRRFTTPISKEQFLFYPKTPTPLEIIHPMKLDSSKGLKEPPLPSNTSVFTNMDFFLIKREDKNKSGSFKDRSLTYWMSYLYSQKHISHFCISSSGNSAIAAASIAAGMGIRLDVFISENIPDYKFNRLKTVANQESMNSPKNNIKIHVSKRPKSDAIKFSRDNNAHNLRSSEDDMAIEGYKTLIYEIEPDIKKLKPDSLFICCSSGTSALGFYRGMKDIDLLIPIHIVQTEKIHPIAKEFDTDFTKKGKSIVSAISDRVAKRKKDVLDAVLDSGGSGWVVSDRAVKAQQQNISASLIKSINYVTPEMGAVFAAVEKAIRHKTNIKAPLVIFSG